MLINHVYVFYVSNFGACKLRRTTSGGVSSALAGCYFEVEQRNNDISMGKKTSKDPT